MKKKIFGVALIATMAVTAGWNFNQSKNEAVLSDLTLANVEALAQGELPDAMHYRVEVSIGPRGSPQRDCFDGGKSFCY